MSFSDSIQQQVKANRDLLLSLPYCVNMVYEWNPETLDYDMAIQYGTIQQEPQERPVSPYACKN